ncbi:hypothetical protein BJV82DRAFT_584568 [Fennellomyces sp. T-0311]|nr:hypothetical protein BJV82DRAFT_584568 [Fennellomyces sp. T-0311]
MSLQLFTSEMEEIQYEFLLSVNYDPDEEFAIRNKAVADNCNSESDSESDSDDDDDGEEMEMEDQYQVISQEYNFATILMLLDHIQETGCSAAAAGRKFGVAKRTAQRYWARYTNGDTYLRSELVAAMNQFKKVVLTDEHTAFLENLYDKDPSTTLKEAKQELKKHFDIDITQSGLQKHLLENATAPN